LSEDKNLTSAQVLKYATSLGHSPERFYQYRKFDVVSQKGSGGMKRMQKRKMKEVELYKPFKSKAKNKLHSVYVKNEHTGKPKIIHFGDSRYNQNTSAKARKAYLRRSAGIRDKTGQLTKDNKNSANYWSRTYLWNAD
jgi:TFIIF-interacting CTD phosphatase-like protein